MRPIPKISSTSAEQIDSRLRAFLDGNDIPTAARMSNLINYFREPALRDIEAEFGLTRPEVGILLFLNVCEGITAAEFCEFSGQLKVGVSRAVALLEEKGLIRREMDTSDNRRQRLFMKDAGRKLYKRYIPMLRAREQSMLSCLSAAERNQLDGLLDKLNRHVASLARQRDL